jgi:CheY-like chemotaxis protein
MEGYIDPGVHGRVAGDDALDLGSLGIIAGGEGSPAGEAGGPSVEPKRVLIVDDNEQAAECLAVIVNLWGHDVRVVFQGSETIRSAREFRPDVILLDIGLPGVDGYSLARTIRGEPGLRDVMLVALTGFGLDEDRRRAAEAGFDRHMLKPVELDVLEALVAEAPRAA